MRAMILAALWAGACVAGCSGDRRGGPPVVVADGGAPTSDGGSPLVGDGGRCVDDPDCDDGVHCNGAEACVEGTCIEGEPPTCDDSDPCTTDTCNEETTDCSHGGADSDGDGHTALGCGGGDDCDDTDASRYAGALDVCNLLDEDCDPSTFGELDADGDGYFDATCCNGTTCGSDCDD